MQINSLTVLPAMSRLITFILFAWASVACAEGPSAKVRIEGVEDKTLKKALNLLIRDLETEVKGKRLASARRSAQRYVPVLIRRLRSQGYVAAKVQVVTLESEPSVVFQVTVGEPFLVRSVKVEPVGVTELPPMALPGLKVGAPLRAGAVLVASETILMTLRRKGYAYPDMEKTKVVADHASSQVDITFKVKPGPYARFGQTEISGLVTLRPYVVHRYVPWYQGQVFDVRPTEEVRTKLVTSGLFSVATVTPAPEVDANGQLNIRVKVVEREHRTVRFGVSYKTDEELGAGVSWEHRNFHGSGERLRLSARASGFGETGEAAYRIPAFMRRDQSLLLGMKLGRENPDAYESVNLQLSTALERELSKTVTVSGGVAFRAEEIEQQGETDSFGLFSLPARFRWNTTNDLLDATRGFQLDMSAEPFADTFGSGLTFFKSQNVFSWYLPLTKRERLVVASKVGFGFLVGDGNRAIPADLRFYAGGGGSIRGYKFQSVGPRLNGEPTGGRSLLDGSVELRGRISKSFGAVLFTDGGTVFENYLPDSAGEFRFSIGAGIRYFTGIGPFRIDFGVPVNRRSFDDRFQVYVSLGQSF